VIALILGIAMTIEVPGVGILVAAQAPAASPAKPAPAQTTAPAKATTQPKAAAQPWLGSERMGKGSFSSLANFSCDLASSAETPKIWTPAFWNRSQASRKAQASLVQPGVPSFG